MENRIKKFMACLLVLLFLLEDPIVVRAHEMHMACMELFSLQEDGMGAVGADSLVPYGIQYELNGGVNSFKNPSSYRAADLPLQLDVPTRTGYNFAGWHTDSHFQNKITAIGEGQVGNLVLYARWTKKIDDAKNIDLYSYHMDSKIRRGFRTLKECNYQVLDGVSIPGMPSTREEDIRQNRILDENQCPQGLCITKDFILVTAYSVSLDALGALYLFDRDSGEYLATIGMKKNSHLGGVAYDGRNIWICHSDDNTLERIPYAALRETVREKPQQLIDFSNSIEAFHIENRPSCITFHDGKLWVATQRTFVRSIVVSYRFDGDTLKKMDEYSIPARVQGIAFREGGRVYLSTSLGRMKSSYLKVYASIEKMDKNPNKPMKKVEMPPCSEEVDIYGKYIYVLFESAGQKYFEGTDGKGSSVSPLEKVIRIRLSSI